MKHIDPRDVIWNLSQATSFVGGFIAGRYLNLAFPEVFILTVGVFSLCVLADMFIKPRFMRWMESI